MGGKTDVEAVLEIPEIKGGQIWKERPTFFWMLAALLISIPLVELLVPTPQDIRTMFAWMGLAYEKGVAHVYAGDPGAIQQQLGDFSPNYPPLIFWVYYPWYAVLRFWGWAGLWPSTVANLLFRLPLFLAQAFAAIVVGRYALKRTEDPKLAWLAIGANPALIVAGPLWGQFEVFQWTACYLAVGTLLAGQPIFSGLWLAIAFLTKPQFVFFAPLVALASLHVPWGSRARAAVALLAFVALAVAPFTLADGLSWFRQGFGRLFERQDALTITAFNLWWLTGKFLGWTSADQTLFSVRLGNWALAVTATVTALPLVRYIFGGSRSPSFVPMASAYFVSLYAFLPGMSARFLAFGLLWTLVWALDDRKALYFALALSVFLFIGLLYNPFFVAQSRFRGLIPEPVALLLATTASAGVVGIALWMTARCWRGARGRLLAAGPASAD